jgi:hypothetical protein
MSETPPPLPVTTLAPDEVATLLDYQLFLKRHGLERKLYCADCEQPADPGDGQTGWKCACRLLVWRLQ